MSAQMEDFVDGVGCVSDVMGSVLWLWDSRNCVFCLSGRLVENIHFYKFIFCFKVVFLPVASFVCTFQSVIRIKNILNPFFLKKCMNL